MPAAEYETRTDSVLAWKKAQKLGRFDPDAPSIEQQKILASEREVEERGKPNHFQTHTFVTPVTHESFVFPLPAPLDISMLLQPPLKVDTRIRLQPACSVPSRLDPEDLLCLA